MRKLSPLSFSSKGIIWGIFQIMQQNVFGIKGKISAQKELLISQSKYDFEKWNLVMYKNPNQKNHFHITILVRY